MSNVINGNVSDTGLLKGTISGTGTLKGSLNGILGKDGVSPVITVTPIKGGNRITIADAEGTKTVDVMDGKDGTGGSGGGGGVDFEVGVGLDLTDGVLSVDSASDFNGDNSRPAEAALVQTLVGNVETILKTI